MITEIDGHKVEQEHFMYRGYLIILTTEEVSDGIIKLKASTCSSLGVLHFYTQLVSKLQISLMHSPEIIKIFCAEELLKSIGIQPLINITMEKTVNTPLSVW
jgi:hypothetical protein